MSSYVRAGRYLLGEGSLARALAIGNVGVCVLEEAFNFRLLGVHGRFAIRVGIRSQEGRAIRFRGCPRSISALTSFDSSGDVPIVRVGVATFRYYRAEYSYRADLHDSNECFRCVLPCNVHVRRRATRYRKDYIHVRLRRVKRANLCLACILGLRVTSITVRLCPHGDLSIFGNADLAVVRVGERAGRVPAPAVRTLRRHGIAVLSILRIGRRKDLVRFAHLRAMVRRTSVNRASPINYVSTSALRARLHHAKECHPVCHRMVRRFQYRLNLLSIGVGACVRVFHDNATRFRLTRYNDHRFMVAIKGQFGHLVGEATTIFRFVTQAGPILVGSAFHMFSVLYHVSRYARVRHAIVGP